MNRNDTGGFEMQESQIDLAKRPSGVALRTDPYQSVA